MIFTNENISVEIIKQIIQSEKIELQFKNSIYNELKNSSLLFMKKIADSMYVQTEENMNTSTKNNDFLEILQKQKHLLDAMSVIKEQFQNITAELENLTNFSDNVTLQINEYNNHLADLQKNLQSFLSEYDDFSGFVLNSIKLNFFEGNDTQPTPTSNAETSSATENSNNVNSSTTSLDALPKSTANATSTTSATSVVSAASDSALADNNCLLISEVQGKVFLPYKLSELEKRLSNSGYSNINELIQNEYIVPINRFKNPIISRFKETYNLMKNKENSSLIDTLNLALELSFNSTLNPAVIAACNNKYELDIYLSYLYDGELENFKIFDIKYEIPPTLH